MRRVLVRVTFVTAAADLSGGCRVIATHSRLLRERGHEVRVVAPAPRAPTPRERARAWVRRRPLPAETRRGLSHFDLQRVPLRRLERARAIEPRDLPDADVVVATWWKTAEWVRALPRRKGAKAYFVQGWEETLEMQPRLSVRDTLAWPFHKITISRDLADRIAEHFGEEDVTIARNAIDAVLFDAPVRGRQPRPTLGVVYAKAHCKGFDVARTAIEIVRESIPDLRVIAFGAEPPDASCPLPPGCEFELRPEQSRIAELYASADVWLSSSRLEGFGLPALEAMACRAPLVTTRYGGTPEIVVDGNNGFLVDPGDAAALADRAIDVLRMSPEQWSAMSEAAHRSARAHTWMDASRAFESGLRRAIEKA